MLTGRLQMLSHPATAAVKTPAFPGDEPLDAEGCLTLRGGQTTLRPARTTLTAPERRCRQTADALGLVAVVDPELRECDYGRWIGRTLAEVARDDAAGVGAWLADVGCAPHGGESHAALLARVGEWLRRQGGVGGRTVAITHASVLRAAIVHVLGAPPGAFWRIGADPLACASFTHHDGRWLFRGLNQLQPLRSTDGTSAD